MLLGLVETLSSVAAGSERAMVDECAMLTGDTPAAHAIVLARGGSVGIPGKNLKQVAGQPLVVRAARAASLSGFRSTWVSSDSDEILTASCPQYAQPIKRPVAISGPSSASEEAMVHAIQHVAEHLEEVSADDLFFLVQPTSPFLSPEDLREGLSKLGDGSADSVFAAVPFHGFVWKQDHPELWVPQGFAADCRQMRQDLPTAALESGAFYGASGRVWMEGRRFGRRPAPVLMDKWRGIDIDSPDDLVAARLLSPAFDPLPSGLE